MTDIYAHDFLDRMAIGKQNAMNRRNRGLGTGGPGTVIWKASDQAPVDHASFAELLARVQRSWAHDRDNGIDGFRFACHGDDWLEGFPL